MNHLNDCVHRWHCVSGSGKDYFLPCNNGRLLQDVNRLYLWISNTVAYGDPENGRLAPAQVQVYLPHERLWGKFIVPFLFNRCLDDQFRSVSFDLQQLKLWILFSGHTSPAYAKWEWKIDHWLIKSTQHSLPSLRRPSTTVFRPGQLVSSGSGQS